MPELHRVRPPGPPQLPLIGNSFAFGRNPYRFLLEAAQHGPVASLRLFARPFFLVSSPELVQQGLVHSARSMRKDDGLFDLIRRGLGNGLATSENPLWRHQRKMMAHAFTPARVNLYADRMAASAMGSVDRWQNGETLELHEATAEIVLEAVSQALFRVSVRSEADNVFRCMNDIGDFFVEAFASPFPLPHWWPSPRNYRFTRACREMNSVLDGIINKRRATSEDGNDLLSVLLEGKDASGRPLSNQQIRDECMTMLVAGHETSGLALMYTLYLLSRHPEVERKVRAEIARVIGNRQPLASDVKGLAYTTQVIKESLRLYPPAWMTARVLLEDIELGGYPLRKGAALIFSPWVTHRDPRYFPEPERFDPERWSPDRAKGLPRYAFIPFGAGPRACIGHHFAMMELAVIVATLMQRCRFELVSKEEVQPGVSVTSRPSKDLFAKVYKDVDLSAARRRPSSRSAVRKSAAPAARQSSAPGQRREGPPSRRPRRALRPVKGSGRDAHAVPLEESSTRRLDTERSKRRSESS